MTWAASQPNLRKKSVMNIGMPDARLNHELSLPPAQIQRCNWSPKSKYGRLRAARRHH
jgi:hypothetical protein